MSSPIRSLALSAALATLALSYPHAVRRDEGPGLYTLTAYAPDNAQYNSLKVQYGGNLNLFQEKTGSYCPDPPLAQFCPNGTDIVFAGTFYPVSIQALKKQDSFPEHRSPRSSPAAKNSMSTLTARRVLQCSTRTLSLQEPIHTILAGIGHHPMCLPDTLPLAQRIIRCITAAPQLDISRSRLLMGQKGIQAD